MHSRKHQLTWSTGPVYCYLFRRHIELAAHWLAFNKCLTLIWYVNNNYGCCVVSRQATIARDWLCSVKNYAFILPRNVARRISFYNLTGNNGNAICFICHSGCVHYYLRGRNCNIINFVFKSITSSFRWTNFTGLKGLLEYKAWC